MILYTWLLAGATIWYLFVQFGLGFALITIATRFIDGSLVALLSLVEVVLAPLWVWIGIGEAPTTIALAGGVVVLGSVMVQALAVRWSAPG